jgi:hypothetical protein
VWQYFRNEIIDIINTANQRENINTVLEYSISDLNLIQHLLPSKFYEIVQPDFSIKPVDDVDPSLQLSEDQEFTTDSKNPRIPSPANKFYRFKNTLSVIDLASDNPDQYLLFKQQLGAADKFLAENKLVPFHSQPEDLDKIDEQKADPYNWNSQMKTLGIIMKTINQSHKKKTQLNSLRIRKSPPLLMMNLNKLPSILYRKSSRKEVVN